MTAALIDKVSAVAAEASSIPGSDPAVAARLAALAEAFGHQYSKTEGMDLAQVREGASKLSSGGSGGSGGGSKGGIAGTIIKFLVDVVSKIGADLTAGWFTDLGVSEDEKRREDGEAVQGDNAAELCEQIEQCCRSIEEIDSTADTAIDGVLQVVIGLVGIARANPYVAAGALILPLVVEGVEHLLGIVEDRNDQVRTALGAVTDQCNGMLEHQPDPPRQWQCPEPEPQPCVDQPAPAPAQAPVQAPAQAPAQAPTVAAQCEDAGVDKPAPAPPQASGQVPTVAAQCEDAGVDRLKARADGAITFDFSCECTHTASLAAPSREAAVQCAPPQPLQTECFQGALAELGFGVTLAALDVLSVCIEGAIHDLADACEEPAPPPPPPEPCPEEPAPPPPPPEPPARDEFAPPPELAEVPEPPAPAEKLRAAGLASPAPEPAPSPEPAPAPAASLPEPPPAAQPAPAEPPSAPKEQPPAPPAESGGPKMRKSGEW
ncbi:hypothetical protein [Corynebacterium liangguodongii]|uniref:hypothetical protein n=1 Tax=Corynebacterium liangguodongii TaxID=2079535 RepID=UPI0018EE6FC0|nr:hypothetical protein [Corynebacterium liangguodongii]